MASASPTRTAVWSVPRCAATAAASDDSSKERSANPTVKVRTGIRRVPLHQRHDRARVDSPERNAPTGTSATILAATACDKAYFELVGHLGIRPGQPVLPCPGPPLRPWTNNSVAAGSRPGSASAASPGDQEAVFGRPARWCRARERSCAAGKLVTARRSISAPESRQGRQGLQLGSECEDLSHPAVVEGLLAETVTQEVELSLSPVPERRREHPFAGVERPIDPPALDRRDQAPRCPNYLERPSRHLLIVAVPRDSCRSLRCRPSPIVRRTTPLAARRSSRDRSPPDAGGQTPLLRQRRPRRRRRRARGAQWPTPSPTPAHPAVRPWWTRSGRECQLSRTCSLSPALGTWR